MGKITCVRVTVGCLTTELYHSRIMTRNNCFQMLTILALVTAIAIAAHNFVPHVLKVKCIYMLSLQPLLNTGHNWVERVCCWFSFLHRGFLPEYTGFKTNIFQMPT